MATETIPTPWTPRQEGEPPTPYDKWFEETPECDLTGEAFHMVTHQREGYLRAVQDMAPRRPSPRPRSWRRESKTETIPTPYDAELTNAARSVGVSKEERDAIERLLLKREGYLRAMQDRTIRESHHRLLEILALVCEEGITTRNLNNALEAIAQAEALEKGEA